MEANMNAKTDFLERGAQLPLLPRLKGDFSAAPARSEQGDWANLGAPKSFAPGTPSVLADPLVKTARLCAHQGFVGKTRKVPKGSGLTPMPYVIHCESVAQQLADFGFRAEVVAAGYLHDHDEDLKAWPLARLQQVFGKDVAALVYWVTQNDKGISWEQRNDLYAEKLKSAPAEAKALSLADKTDNIKSLIHYLEMGFKVEELLKKGWAANSEKFHKLVAVYEGQVPEKMLANFKSLLAYFDALGGN